MAKRGPKSKKPIDRFMAKVDKTDTCWVWKGATSSNGGYGLFFSGEYRDNDIKKPINVYAHRWYWEYVHRSQLDNSVQLDHLCRTSTCVNPDHLEEVDVQTNIQRGMNVHVARRRIEEILEINELSDEDRGVLKKAVEILQKISTQKTPLSRFKS